MLISFFERRSTDSFKVILIDLFFSVHLKRKVTYVINMFANKP